MHTWKTDANGCARDLASSPEPSCRLQVNSRLPGSFKKLTRSCSVSK